MEAHSLHIAFTKMHGAGNDFVVIDARKTSVELTADQARRLADRKHGVGCDQIMVMFAVSHADLGYRIYNADGSAAQQCGNGARAVAWLAHQRGAAGALLMRSPAGPVRARIKGDAVSVDMGPARFEPDAIPLNQEQTQPSYEADGLTFGAVSIGNPHAVIDVRDAATTDVDTIAAKLRATAVFPKDVNVGFVQIVNRQQIALRVVERGVGETLACGTGACAAVAVGVQNGHLDPVVQVRLPGGNLMVDCSELETAIWLTGPAHVAFEGHIQL